MTRLKTLELNVLNAYFSPDTFGVDGVENQDDVIKTWIEALEAEKYNALYHLGFLKKEK